ncbi:ABC transporter ATP-binding protein, partial [Dietzia sp. SLG510A3-30A2]|nr:ABC transporter ATP-binding protein [Dietzia sp. SLG510A3-30A2]
MTSPTDTPALHVEGLVKRFGATTAVAGLDLRLERGQVMALLGPNGAGKTTTVEICEGFARPDAGTVRVLGLDPVIDRQRVRSRIGMMLQGGGSYPAARVGEMLRLVASYYADPLDPDWLLGELGLTEHVRTPYRRLSGGQQQRLSLAIAVIGRPELVFLDEPTAGLDAQSRRAVWDLVHALRRDGAAVLLTTHLMDEAASLADEVVIVDHG